MVHSRLHSNIFKTKRFVKESQEVKTTEKGETQEIELTEEQLAQLLGGGMSNIPQMLVDPFLLNFYTRLENREILINNTVDDDLIEYYQYILDWVDEDNQNNIPISERTPIKLYINTNGGALDSTLFLVDLLSTIEQKIITIGMSKCYSAGCILLLAGQKGNRYVFKNTDILLHDGQYGSHNSTGKVLDELRHMERVENKLKMLVLEKTGLTSEKYDKKYREEWYLDAETAIEYGFADKIITNINDIL